MPCTVHHEDRARAAVVVGQRGGKTAQPTFNFTAVLEGCEGVLILSPYWGNDV